jgi:hypothetical protein
MTSAEVVCPSRHVVILIVIPAVFTRPASDVSVGIVVSTGVVGESDYVAVRVVVAACLVRIRDFRLGGLHLLDIFGGRVIGTRHAGLRTVNGERRLDCRIKP